MAPTAFVAEGPIAMVASTNVFMAGPELRAMPSVSRCRRKPITLTSVVALTTVVPAVEETRVTEHDPVPPEVVQLEALRVPGPLTLTNLMTVPSFALTNPEPELTFTWPVRVWGFPTSLVAAPRTKSRMNFFEPFHWKGLTIRSLSRPSIAEASTVPSQLTVIEP